MKRKLTTILLILLLFIGLSLLLYPSISDYWNSKHNTKAIAGYTEAVEKMEETDYEAIFESARNYNAALANRGNVWKLGAEQMEEYKNQLVLPGTDVMGYVEIPSISCTLPIYHGIDEAVLQVAIGHLEGSSLPVGGESTHTVLSGHRGLPSAKLFTDLDQLGEGDIFMIQVLNETLTYEVDQILIVLPNELDALTIEKGKDLCTLVTCTPYGVNSHRLLVRGHRVDNLEESYAIRVSSEAQLIDERIVAPIIAIPILLFVLIIVLINDRGKRKSQRYNYEKD